MKKNKSLFFVGSALLCMSSFLAGCSQMLLFDPKGPIGETERLVIIVSFVLMLIVVIPVFIMAVWFPLKYRSDNTRASYDPKWSHSVLIESIIWLVPALIVTALGIITWKTTHQLDPHKPIETTVKPVIIEAVSLDWKWLFIYPEQNIATVNQIVFPVNAPLNFKLTSATVMTSFFIPQLGSQIYAMAGMQTQLHLLADETGVYDGQNQQFSGHGYADMNFKAQAVEPGDFESWIEKVRQSPEKLDMGRFQELERSSINDPVIHFSGVKPGLFNNIMGRYNSSMNPDPLSTAAGTGSGQPNSDSLENN